MKYFQLITLAGLLLITSCYQDRDDSEEIIITPVPVPETITGLSGNLIDPNTGTIEQDYTLVINETEHAVASEVFFLDAVTVKKQGQLLEAYRGEQLIGLGFNHLIEYDLNKVELVTINESTQRLEPAGEEWTLDLGPVSLSVSGASISALTFRTSVMDQLRTQMALGSTGFAFDTEGQAQLLSTVPAYGFTLRSAELERLEDIEYRLVFDDVDAGQVLLHYNRASQQWHQIAQLSENMINVTKLGYYMVAQANTGVYIQGQVLADGRPISFLRSQMDHLQAYEFYTTEQGRWGAVLPEMQDVKLDYLTPCDEPISGVSLNVQEGQAEQVNEIASDEQSFFQWSAEVIDCSGAISMADGVQLSIGADEETLLFSEGASDIQLAVCDSEFSVAAYSIDDNEAGPAVEWNSEFEEELGLIVGCNNLADGFVYLKIRDDEVVYSDVEAEQEAGTTIVSAFDALFWISFRGTTADSYNAEDINIVLEDANFGQSTDGYIIGCATSEVGCGISELTVTHYQENNGLLRFSFSGEVFMRTYSSAESGNFPVSGIVQIRL